MAPVFPTSRCEQTARGPRLAGLAGSSGGSQLCSCPLRVIGSAVVRGDRAWSGAPRVRAHSLPPWRLPLPVHR